MKAAESAPSPKSLRKRLGIENATMNAEETIPAPKNLAETLSRAIPRMRLSNVSPPISFACATNDLPGGAVAASAGAAGKRVAASSDIHFL
jgi:hypothetical protein